LLSKSNHLLNKFKIDQTELAILFDSAQNLLTNLKKINDGIQREIFNESLLKFEKQKSFDSNIIGKIVKQNIDLHFLENIENMREFDFAFKTVSTHNFRIKPFKSNSFLLLYTEEDILNLLCFDRVGILLEKKG
jgi:Tfp pilus assembly pilus retraction ATPase PilT